MGDRPRLPQFIVFFYVEKNCFLQSSSIFFRLIFRQRGICLKKIAIEFEKLARERVPILKA